MRAYSMDLRERALLDSDAGMKAADVAAKYRVSGSWVRLLKQRRRETGEVAPRVQRHGRRCMLEPHLHTLAALIAAHPDHLIAEVYDVKRTMTVDGRVDRIVLRNPHAFVHLSVVGTEGQSRTWAIELEGATTLRRRGVDGATFKIGDQLTVCGNPGRDASQYRLLMLGLRRPSDSFSMHRTDPRGG